MRQIQEKPVCATVYAPVLYALPYIIRLYNGQSSPLLWAGSGISSTDPYKPICWAVYPGFLIPQLIGEGLSPEVGKKSIPKIGQPPQHKKVSASTQAARGSI